MIAKLFCGLLPFLLLSCNENSPSTHPISTTANDVSTFANTNAHAHLFSIVIDRKIKGENCTQGYLIVNGEVMAYTLELPDLNNQEYISSIPKGTYDAKIRTNGDLGWRIELLDVPGREYVQIHVGNYTRQIEGCILIGTNVSLTNCNVTNAYRHEAMLKLQEKLNTFTSDLILNQGSTEPVNIQVEVSGI